MLAPAKVGGESLDMMVPEGHVVISGQVLTVSYCWYLRIRRSANLVEQGGRQRRIVTLACASPLSAPPPLLVGIISRTRTETAQAASCKLQTCFGRSRLSRMSSLSDLLYFIGLQPLLLLVLILTHT